MRLQLALLCFTCNTFAAGPFLFGVRGGAPVLNTSSIADRLAGGFGSPSISHEYQLGPTAGVRLPLGFSIEGDALFHRQSLDFGQFAGFTAANLHSDSWEFPVMMKFAAGHRAIAPVLGAGISVRHFNNFSQVPGFLFGTGSSANAVGFVAGAGLRCKLGPVEITPELRYTRWNSNTLSQSLVDFLPLGRNEASVLVGLTF